MENPNPDALTRALRHRWLIFWVLAAGYVLVYFHRLCPAVLAVDMMRDLGAGGTLAGLLGSAYFYPYAAMQLPAGVLADSWGPRRTVALFLVVGAVGSVLLGLAPTVGWAIAGRVLVGLGVSLLFVGTMKVLAEWFRPAEFASMAGILMAMGGVGSLTAAAPLAVVSAWLGWRGAFAAVGAVTLALAAGVWLVVRDRPADLGWPSPAGERPRGEPPIPLAAGVRRVLAHGPFWALALWFFFDCAIFFAFGGLWGGPYLQQVYGLSRGEAGRVLSLLAVGMIVGSPLLGHASSRWLGGRKPVLVGCSAVTVGLTAALALATDRLSLGALYGICFGLGMFTSAVVTVGFTAAKELFPVRMAGTATGLVNLFPFAGGAVAQPLLGWALESHGRVGGAFTVAGYRTAFLLLLGSAAAALAASLAVKETLGRGDGAS